jgi:hypothetical protein
MPEQVEGVITALDSHRVKLVMWSRFLELPGPEFHGGYHLAPLLRYLHTKYYLVISFPDGDQVWERNEQAR